MKKRTILFLLCLFIGFNQSYAQAPFNGFIRFDGVDDELTQSMGAIPANSSFTVEFWFRSCQNDISLQQTIFCNDRLLNVNIYGSNVPGDPVFYQTCGWENNPNTDFCYQGFNYTPDFKWHHYAVTYDAFTKDFDGFFDGLDGDFDAMGSEDFYPYNDPDIKMGLTLYMPQFEHHFKGYVDELRISNVVRYNGNGGQIFTPPAAAFVPDANTVGLWHFDENNPLVSPQDVSGNNYHFTKVGNPMIIRQDSLNKYVSTINGNTTTIDLLWNPPAGLINYTWQSNNGQLVSGQGTRTGVFTGIGGGSVSIIYSDPVTGCELDTFSFMPTAVSSFNEQAQNFRFYPSIASEEVTLEFLDEIPAELELSFVDISGRQVLNKKMELQPGQLIYIPIAELSKGSYFAIVKTQGKTTFTSRFFKTE